MDRRERKIAKVLDAFADRQPIAWDKLLGGSVSASDRTQLEHFRALESWRLDTDASDGLTSASPRTADMAVTWFACGQLVAMVSAAIAFAVTFGTNVTQTLSRGVLVAAFAGGAVLLLAAEQRTSRVRALMNVFLICAVAFMRPVLGAIAVQSLAVAPRAFISVTSRLYPEAFLAAAFWSFALDFPRGKRLTCFDTAGRWIVQGVWCFGILLFLVNLPGDAAPPPLHVLLRDDPRNAFWFLLSVPIAAALVTIAARIGAADLIERRKVWRCAAGFGLGAAPFLVLALVRMGSPSLDRAFSQASPAQRWPIDLVVLTALAAMPLTTAFTVVADRALDVRIVVHRATQYAFTAHLLKALLAGSVALLALLLYAERHRSVAEILEGSRGKVVVAFGATASVLLVFRRRIAGGVDRLFGLHASDHRIELNSVLDHVRNARGFREAAFTTAAELQRVVRARAVSIIRLDAGEPECIAGRDFHWRSGCALQRVAADVGAPVDVSARSPLFVLLPQADRHWITEHRVAALAPIRRRDGRLLGIIIAGGPHSGLPLLHDDCWLLASAATLLAVAWPSVSSLRRGRSNVEHDVDTEDVALECGGCHRILGSVAPTCACAAAAEPASVPRVISGTFALVRRIGRGGMGVVYLAEDIHLGRHVAIKTLPAASAEAIADLRQEARAMAALRHDGIAVLYGIEVWRDTPALIVEYCGGGTLSERLAHGPLPLDAVVDLARRLLDTLMYVHRRGMAHGDLKPSNIGFAADGGPKLLDFGLASAIQDCVQGDAEGKPSATLIGTRLYLPPEAFNGDDSLRHRDLWAMAIVIAEAITGHHPLLDGAPPVGLRSSMPAIAAVLERALCARRVDRFDSADAFKQALEAAWLSHWRSHEVIRTGDRRV